MTKLTKIEDKIYHISSLGIKAKGPNVKIRKCRRQILRGATMVGAEQIFLQIWSLLAVGNEICIVFPTQYFNILVLPNNEDEYY